MVGIWSDTPQTLATVGNVLPSSQIDLAVVDEDALPDVAKGWDALDVLFISDADSGQLSLAQQEALRTLELSGYARIDLRYSPDGRAYVLEANPNPQLAYGEDFAESAERAGISYEQLLQRIVNLGLQAQPGRAR
jgi:hypothetical protein